MWYTHIIPSLRKWREENCSLRLAWAAQSQLYEGMGRKKMKGKRKKGIER